MKSKYLLLLLFVVVSKLGFSQFKFNEYSCSNVGKVIDPLGTGASASPDWVELINVMPTPQSLTGWYISDERQNLFKWQIPLHNNANIMLDSFNVQVIHLCTHNKTISNPGGVNATSTKIDLHTNFQMIQSQNPGPWLYLTKVTGTRPTDSVQIKRNQPDHSWGKPNSKYGAYNTPEGGLIDTAFSQGSVLWSLYQFASPGKKNPKNPYPLLSTSTRNWYRDYAPTPKFTTKPGYYVKSALSNFIIKDSTYTTPAQAALAHKDSIEIFATTDCTKPLTYTYGATPDPNFNTVDVGPHGTGATNSISVPFWGSVAASGTPPVLTGVVVRAIAHDQSIPPKYLDSFEAYGGYVIDSTYHMNVICTCMDTASLFITPHLKDTVSLIYSYLDNKSHSNKELFKNQAQALVNKIDFLNNLGPASAHTQWQFLIRSEDEYGYNFTNKYNFYQAQNSGITARADFPEIVLRSGSEDNFLKGGTGTVPRHGATHLRDFYNHTITLRHKLDFESSHYIPTYMFINGKNRGIYYIKEPIDSTYIKYYYGHDQSDIIANDLIPTTTNPTITALSGKLSRWTIFYNWIMSNSTDIRNPNTYQAVSDSMDLHSFIEYNFYNMYSVNVDFVKRQALWWRGVKSDTTDHSNHKWRFGLSNTDLTWQFGKNYANTDNTQMSSPCDYITPYGFDPTLVTPTAPSPNYPLIPLFAKLMLNDTFFSGFFSRYQDLVNTSYSCDTLVDHLTYISSLLKLDMRSQVWFNANKGTCASCDSVKLWNAMVDSMKVFIQERCSLAVNAIGASTCIHPFNGPYNLCLDVAPRDATTLPGYIKFNSLTLKSFPWNKSYLDSVTYSAVAVADSNYVFDHWTSDYILSPNNSSDSVTFQVNKPSKHCMIAVFKLKPASETYGAPMLPTAFSPNGDGNDDILNIYGIANATSYDFEIYNRWGQQIFISKDKTQGWDGSFNGEPAAVGVYAYRYDIVVNGKSYIKKGSFTLLR
ncbi:MAG TPA: gliding motility-associated C-terminal domain-containing protein [Bacteroidia bacterium]|nr:gliding motility-associated C-terminal domain-containing protein [Bacteroidia bacterium]